METKYINMLQTANLFFINLALSLALLPIIFFIEGYKVIISIMACVLLSFILISYFEFIFKIKGLFTCFIFIVIIKLFIMIIVLYYSNSDYFTALTAGGVVYGYDDAKVYYHNSINNTPAEIISNNLDKNNLAFDILLSIVARVFNISYGANQIILIVPNLFLGSFLSVIACIIGRYVDDGNQGKTAFWLLAFDPITILHSITLLKDVWVSSLVGIGFIAFKNIMNGKDYIRFIIASSGTLILLCYSRLFAVPLLIIATYFNSYFDKNVKYALNRILLPAVFIVIAIFINYNAISKRFVGVGSAFFEEVVLSEKADTGGDITLGTQYIKSIKSTPIRFLTSCFLSIFTPFPYIRANYGLEVNNNIIMFLGSIYWHCMLPFLFYGLYYLFTKRIYLPIIYFLSVICLLGIANSGDPRWRLMGIAPAYVIIASGMKICSFFDIIPWVYYVIVFLVSCIIYLR